MDVNLHIAFCFFRKFFSGLSRKSATMPPQCTQWSVSKAGRLVRILWYSLKGPHGGFPYFPYGPAALFFYLLLIPSLNTVLETILLDFGYHVASILDAPGHKNEAQNASPSSTGQNPEFADGCALFIIFMIPKASQKAPKWRQNPFQIDDFCKMHSWSYFFHLLFRLRRKMMKIFKLFWETRGAANEPSFSSLFLSWGPLGAEVVPKLSPRASWASILIAF